MGSVTHWIEELKEGDQQAVAALWERYFEKLVRYARKKLEGQRRRVADEEDIALTAFSEFCRAADQGRYPVLADREGLWRLLLCITGRRAADLKKRNAKEKRWLKGESALPSWDSEAGGRALAEVVGDGPSPAMVAASTEVYQRLYGLLGDPKLQTVARLKLAGYKNTEIAEQMNCALRTVERKLKLIRRIWEEEQR